MPQGPTERILEPLTEAQQDLVVEHIPLARKLAFQACGRHRQCDHDQLYSQALYALVRAAKMWEDRGTSQFGVYAEIYIKGYLLHESARIRRLSALAFSELMSADSDDLPDFAGDGRRRRRPADSLESREQVDRLLGIVPRREQIVLRAIYCQGLSHKEIAEKVGVSPTAVEKMHNRSLDMIRRRFLRRDIRPRTSNLTEGK